jgi:DNA-binding IclR family transcriptional regulator
MADNLSLSNGIEILLLYGTSTPLLTVAEISEKLGYSQSKTYRLVRTLLKYNLLQKKPETNQYTLGLNALRLGLLAKQNFGLSAIARPFMEELSKLTKETVLLFVLNGTKRILLEKVESEEAIRYSSPRIEQSRPLTCGASGKILMAYLPKEDWDRILAREGLEQRTPNSITDENQLKEQLKEIRKKGFAFSDQELDIDVRGVAAPIINRMGNVEASLSIGGPVYRMNKKRIKELVKLVVEYSQKISSNLG